MPVRFVVTGSGRCGTRYMSRLLTAAGVPCGHEQVFNIASVDDDAPLDWGEFTADSSWMALHLLPGLDVPVVLLTRHPLLVARSLVEIGYFSHHDESNPCHGASQAICPEMYDEDTPADRALAMWLHWNRVALGHAEARFKIERFDAAALARLLRWSGHDDGPAGAAFAQAADYNRHEILRARTGIVHPLTWDVHRPELAEQARDLACTLGYDPDRPEVG